MKYLFSIALISLSFIANAQMPSPVHWDVQVHKDETGAWISLDADMDDTWVVYSQHMNDDGPVPTTFEYNIEGGAKVEGTTEELSDVIIKYSDLFEMDVKKFKNKARFKQNILVTGSGTVSVDVTYMTCSGNKCLPPRTETFMLKF